MIFNILFIVISTIILYKKRIALCEEEKEKEDTSQTKTVNSLYNKYIYFTIGVQCVINIIINLIGCSSNFGEVIYVILYTLITWISFIIIVTFKQYLRIPMANVFGYLWYYRPLSKALQNGKCETLSKLIDMSGNNLDIFYESSALIKDDTNNKLVYINEDNIPTIIPTECTSLIQACCKRDVFGEFILFLLSGIMCVFMSEYILTQTTCKNKPVPGPVPII